MAKLTNSAISAAKPRDKEYTMTDGRGLVLLIKHTGAKLWRLRYTINGRRSQIGLGRYPDTPLARARLLRELHLTDLATGVDPAEKRRQEKADREANRLTFKTVAERWFQANTRLSSKPWASPTECGVRFYLDKDILPALGDMPIARITRRDLFQTVKRMEERGAVEPARKAREWLMRIFDNAINAGDLESNPTLGMKASDEVKNKSSTPHPNVGFAGLPALLTAVDASGSHILIKYAIRLLALIGCRPSELRLAKWEEFDLESATWRIPAERMKMRREQQIPLSRQAVTILEQIREIRPDGYLFVVQGHKPLSAKTIGGMLTRLGYGGKQTAHSFRHLLSTELHERNYSADWIEVQLSHIIPGMRGIYNGAQYLDQRRAMMQDWADSIDAVTSGANVIAFKRMRA